MISGMALVLIDGTKDYYLNLMSSGDPRVKEWPMMEGPLPTLSICLSYVMFVKVLGPQIMKNRKPLNIRWLMILYNFVMVFASTYLFVKLGVHGWFGKYNYKCQPVDYSDNPDAIGMASMAWWYYITKFIEFSDTIFFVLRKKFSHVSTLHVIHHGVMPMSVWWGVKFTPGGHSTFFAFLNSFIHIIMYIYYGMASIGPQMNKYLWWKKYMTSFQMVQFVLIFVHSFQLLFRDCNYPRGFMWWIGFHAVLFWFLFMDFYKSTYSKRQDAKKSSSQSPFFACSQTESFINGMNGIANGNGTRTTTATGHANGTTTSNGTTLMKRNLANGVHQVEVCGDQKYSSTVKNNCSSNNGNHNSGL